MGELYAYAGKILYVDLSTGKSWTKELDEELIDKYVGGVGIATKIFLDEIPNPKIDPLSPDNPLIFMTGALTGTPVYSSSRHVIVAKSPITQAWGESHIGGYWGVELKKAGYDGIVIKGKAPNPAYLYINDGEVELRDATKYWGLDTIETAKQLMNELEDRSVRVAVIGPAGERLARLSGIFFEPFPNGPRVAGRTGMGAVMGSKNLKAVVLKGSGKIRVKDTRKITYILSRLLPLIMSSPTVQIQALYGTAGEVQEFYEYGDMPIKNFTKGVFENIERLTGKALKESGMVTGVYGCWACPVKCWKLIDAKGVKQRAPEYETLGSLGTLLMISDPLIIKEANELCNRYGLDTIGAGVTLAWAFESYERGLISKEDTGGLELRWGDGATVLKLIEMMGKREGFGKLLSEGCKRASEIIGKGIEKYCMNVKGAEVPMHDPRAFKGMGLQYATSNRGADHLYGLFFRIEEGERVQDLKIYERVDRFTTKGKGWMVATMMIWSEVQESVGVCKFVEIPPAHVAGLYTFATGIKKTLPMLMEVGKRVFMLKRLFNNANGISRKDDTLPERFLKEPLREGGSAGQTVDLETMLNEYYEFMGWDERGVPRKEVLESLGIAEYASKLGVKVE